MSRLVNIKKNCGFVYKWLREIQFKKKETVGISETEAWHHIDTIRPHNYSSDVIAKPRKNPNALDVSFIVPVYNVEKYLQSAIESIVAHAEGLNYEVLLIEDASTDASVDICRELCEKYPSVRLHYSYTDIESGEVLDRQNCGMSVGRNVGLFFAKGKYVCFLDSDDVCLNVKKLFELAEENRADIVEGNFVIFNDETEIEHCERHIKREDTSVMDISNDFSKLSKCAGFAWGKLYRAELWNGVLFPKGFIFEDTVGETVILRKAKRYLFTNEICYGYRKNLNSICYTVNTTPRVCDSVLVYKYWLENLTDDLKDNVFARFLIRQFGSKSYSRIKELPEYEQKCIFVVMGSMIEHFDCVKGLDFYERLLMRALKSKDFKLWKFLCKYCFV